MASDTTDGQLDFLFSQTKDSFWQYLEERLGRPVYLVLTENSSNMLSARVRDGLLYVRLHRMFMNADSLVFDDIVSFLKKRRSRMLLFHGFVRANREHFPAKPPKKVPVRTLGKFHDLKELFHEINDEYFSGMVSAVITWGTKSPRLFVRNRTLGSYSSRSNMIRINPVLDRNAVPRYYVAFVVYHEMLHAALGMPLRGKKRSIHSWEFRKRERIFRDYERAIAWEGGRAEPH